MALPSRQTALSIPDQTVPFSLSSMLSRDRVILNIGDSTTRGKSGGPFPADSSRGEWMSAYPHGLGRVLASCGLAVRFDAWCGASAYSTADLCMADPRIDISGESWNVNGLPLIGGRPLSSKVPNFGFVTFSPERHFNRFKLYVFCNRKSGQIEASFDAGATVEMFSTHSAEPAPRKMEVVLPALAKKVSLRHADGGPVTLFGMVCDEVESPSLTIVNAGWTGSRAPQWTSGDEYAPWQCIQHFDPVLSVINLGINDWTKCTPVPEFEASISSLIVECQKSGKVLLHLAG